MTKEQGEAMLAYVDAAIKAAVPQGITRPADEQDVVNKARDDARALVVALLP